MLFRSLETLWLALVGLGLLAGVFYIAFDSAISPFAPYRVLERPATVGKPMAVPPRETSAPARAADPT